MFNQILYLCLFFGMGECFGHCEKVSVQKEYWENEGVAVIYIMKNSQQNWETHVISLIQLLKSLKNIDINTNLVIATDIKCLAFENIKDFKIDSETIWNKLDHHKEYPEAYVIDRCGKVTYHIIFPWSLVKWFPFIKGAILSTYFDKPCGPCEVFHSYQIDALPTKPSVEEIKVLPKLSEISENESEEGAPPIEIIIKEKHKHEGSDDVFEYTEMELGNSRHHRHFNSIDDIEFAPRDKNIELPAKVLVLDSSEKRGNVQDHFKHTKYKTKTKRVESKSEEQNIFPSVEPKLSELDKRINEIALKCTDVKDLEQSESKYYGKLFENLLEAVYSDETLTSDENEQKDQMSHHYEKLKNWISYII